MRIDPKTFMFDVNERSVLCGALEAFCRDRRHYLRANERTLQTDRRRRDRESIEMRLACAEDLLKELSV